MPRYPARAQVPWEVDDHGAVVEAPRPRGRAWRLLARLLRAPASRQMRLDDVGTRAWLLSDGTRREADIAKRLEEEFGDAVAPARERTRAFVDDLATRGLLVVQGAPRPAEDALRGFPGHRRVACPCGATVRLPGDAAPGARYLCPGCGRGRKARG